ncbi:hypothetical protein Hamer_G003851 [Homarus americanus]|uniref:Uncharacterized protein n=1 Tax=Homarus americanus TaxID=6706 RepID=A0A8J5NC87_HOMAM|nr:hypothetical protein Hamer_G003851 [Homarus americanus]
MKEITPMMLLSSSTSLMLGKNFHRLQIRHGRHHFLGKTCLEAQHPTVFIKGIVSTFWFCKGSTVHLFYLIVQVLCNDHK